MTQKKFFFFQQTYILGVIPLFNIIIVIIIMIKKILCTKIAQVFELGLYLTYWS